MDKIAILTSGGDAPGLNAVIRAIVRTANYHNINVIGFKRGYKGLIENDHILISSNDVSGFLNKGGTFLLTSREPRFKESKYRKIAYENLKKLGIKAIFIIGGNGSFQGAYTFSKEFDIPVIGIPKTIDNDTYGTDYTIGFDTAVNTAVDAIEKIKDTTMSHERIFVVEVMGRKSGFIALETGIAIGADCILIPEYPYPLHKVIQTIVNAKKRGKNFFLIVLAEGVAKAQEFSKILQEKLNEIGDYGEIRYSVLGYIQRGGSPTAYDRVMASRFGVFAVKEFLRGNKNFMVAFEKGSILSKPLEISFGKVKKPPFEEFEIANILNF